MKNILKISTLMLFINVLFSCTNEKDPVVSTNGLTLRQDSSVVSPEILLDANESQPYAIFEWDRSNYGVPTEAVYKIVVSDHDLDPDYSDAKEFTVGLDLSADARKCTLNVGQFNDMINSLPTFKCSQMSIDVRVKSKLGTSTNAVYQFSNPITLTVTGYPKSLPILSLATSSATAGEGAKLASSSYKVFSDYEGYVYLEAGTYKVYKPDACGEFSSPVSYGLSGGASGSLILDGSNGFVVTTAGHYYVKASLLDNLGAPTLTYSITAFNATTNTFGVFGKALRPALGSANTTPMNYDLTTKKWSVTVDMVNGLKFGFKTSSAAPVASLEGSGVGTFFESPLKTITTGPPTDGSINAPGTYVDNNTKTKYAVEVDLSRPRNYTYKLTVVAN